MSSETNSFTPSEDRGDGSAATPSWERVMFAQFVDRDRPWHISKLPGYQIPVGFGAICASLESTGSLIGTSVDELPRFAKLCPDCAAIREEHHA